GRKFAEHVAGRQIAEADFTASCGMIDGTYVAAHDEADVASLVLALEDGLVRAVPPPPAAPRQRLHRVGRETSEERDPGTAFAGYGTRNWPVLYASFLKHDRHS